MRERLVELMRQAEFAYLDFSKMHPCETSLKEFTADYLIANGVIVPPCKVGADLWWIDDEDNQIKVEKNGVKGVVYLGDGKFGLLDEVGNVEEIGTKYTYLSREEAENALRKDVGK